MSWAVLALWTRTRHHKKPKLCSSWGSFFTSLFVFSSALPTLTLSYVIWRYFFLSNWKGKNLGHGDLEGLSKPKFRTEFALFSMKNRIQKKEGFIWTPHNRYGPSSSVSNPRTCWFSNVIIEICDATQLLLKNWLSCVLVDISCLLTHRTAEIVILCNLCHNFAQLENVFWGNSCVIVMSFPSLPLSPSKISMSDRCTQFKQLPAHITSSMHNTSQLLTQANDLILISPGCQHGNHPAPVNLDAEVCVHVCVEDLHRIRMPICARQHCNRAALFILDREVRKPCGGSSPHLHAHCGMP